MNSYDENIEDIDILKKTIEFSKTIYDKFFFDKNNQYVFNYKSNFNSEGKPFYITEMFLYPSGDLHLGHVRGFTIVNVISIYRFMNGYKVFRPFGSDSFGLPAEIAARKNGVKPNIWVNKNLNKMKNLLKKFNFFIDWKSELSTSNINYYAWNQYLFSLFFKSKLIFREQKIMPFCSFCKTFLANEQVEKKRCWRCNNLVIMKKTFQWFLDLKKFSSNLYNNLKLVEKEWPEKVINIQRKLIDYKYEGLITVNNTNYVLKINSKIKIDKNKLCLIFHFSINNVFVDYDINFLYNKFSEIYKKYNIKYLLFNIDGKILFKIKLDKKIDLTTFKMYFYSIFNNNSNKKKIIKKSNKIISYYKKNSNVYLTLFNTNLENWCISRQNKWGTPIPLLYCDNCKKFFPINKSAWPLKLGFKFKTLCLECGSVVNNISDTLTTFFDSAWYYWKYFFVNSTFFLDSKVLKKWNTLDVYVGGIEHATRHLIYTRTFNYIFYKMGILNKLEPIKKLITQGMILSNSFFCSFCRKYLTKEIVNFTNSTCKLCNNTIKIKCEKMSKSKLNYGTNLEELIKLYGVESIRLFILFLAPISMDIIWNENGIKGMYKFLKKFIFFFSNISNFKFISVFFLQIKKKIKNIINLFLKYNNKDIYLVTNNNKDFIIYQLIYLLFLLEQNIKLYKFNVAIALIMKIFNSLEKKIDDIENSESLQMIIYIYLLYCYPFFNLSVDYICFKLLKKSQPLLFDRWFSVNNIYKKKPFLKVVIIDNKKKKDKKIFNGFIFLKKIEFFLNDNNNKIFKKIIVNLCIKNNLSYFNENKFKILKDKDNFKVNIMLF